MTTLNLTAFAEIADALNRVGRPGHPDGAAALTRATVASLLEHLRDVVAEHPAFLVTDANVHDVSHVLDVLEAVTIALERRGNVYRAERAVAQARLRKRATKGTSKRAVTPPTVLFPRAELQDAYELHKAAGSPAPRRPTLVPPPSPFDGERRAAND